MIAAAALWGVSAVVARVLFRRDMEPALLVQVRLLLGGLALLPIVLLRRSIGFSPRDIPRIVLYGLLLAAIQFTYFESIAAAGVAVAVFLQYTAPLMVAAWESAWARRLPEPGIILALALATLGSALLVLPGTGFEVPAAGLAWGLASAVSMAAVTLVATDLRRRGARTANMLVSGLLIGSLAFLPARMPWQALASVPGPAWPYIVYIALFATALPYMIFTTALASVSGSVAVLLCMVEPVLAALLAWAFLGEALSPLQLLGGALILVAIAIAARAR